MQLEQLEEQVTGGVGSTSPGVGPVPERVTVGTAQVRRLIRSQFPQWAGLRVAPVAKGGWDNWTFHLGDDMLLRLPSAAEYAEAVEKEHRWLPRLATQLPVAIPTPLAKGAPGKDYPYPWSVYRWLDGRPAASGLVADPVTFANDLGDFLLALQAVDPTEGPRPGIHNWFRGGTLRAFDEITRRALPELPDHIDVDRTRQVWADSLRAPWDGIERWFHGDVADGNLLLDDAGHLAAVIDFGTCGVGDPACDLAVAWTLLDAQGRQAFRDRLAVDESTWARGRGWALWKSVATCWSALQDPADADELDHAKRVLDTVLDET